MNNATDLLELDGLFEAVIEDLRLQQYSSELFVKINTLVTGWEKNLPFYESYLLELFSEVALIEEVSEFLGYEPSVYHTFYEFIESNKQALGQMIQALLMDQVLNFAIRIHALSSLCVGEIGQIWEHELTGFRDESIRIVAHLQYQQLKHEVENEVVEYSELTTEYVPILSQAIDDYNRMYKQFSNAVWLPVVPLHESKSGNTSKLMKITLEDYSMLDEMDRAHKLVTIGRVSPQILESPYFKEFPLQAAVTTTGYADKKSIRVLLGFDTDTAWLTGNSMGVSFAVLISLAIKRMQSDRTSYVMQAPVAITGCINAEGKVQGVNEQTIEAKLQACIFYGIKVFVCPIEHYDQLNKKLSELKETYPNSKLKLVAVSHLDDIVSDRRLFSITAQPVYKWLPRRIKRKSPQLLGVLVLLIAFYLGFHQITMLDKNPVSYELMENRIVFMNQYQRVVGELEVSERTINAIQRHHSSEYQMIALVDLNQNGFNEVVLINHDTISFSELYAFDILNNQTLWSYRPELGTEYTHNSDINHLRLNAVKFLVSSIKELNKLDLLLLSSTNFFPSVIEQINPITGKPRTRYLHSGHIRRMRLVDNFKNEEYRIVFSGVNNAYHRAVVGVLDPENLNGQSPSFGRHKSQAIEIAKHSYYIKLPHSKIRNYLPVITNLNIADGFIEYHNGYAFSVIDFELEPNNIDNLYHLVFSFDRELRPIGIGTSNVMNMVLQNLIDAGILQERFTPEYKQELMDEIRYYINGEWVRWGDMR